MKKLVCKAVALSFTPVEVAGQLSHLPGLIFIDSSGNFSESDNNPISVVAVDPVKMFQGKDLDFFEIRKAVRHYELEYDGVTEAQASNLPLGGAFGWIGYDSAFCFGVFESCLIYVHQSRQWYEVGDVLHRLKPIREEVFTVGEFRSHTSKDSYINGVEKIKEYIRSGDIYQVNLIL